MREKQGLINFKRVDLVAAASVSVAEAVAILDVYLALGGNLGMTVAVTIGMIPVATLLAKELEIADRIAGRFTNYLHERARTKISSLGR